MWIVLIDNSGSMGEPFEASTDLSRRTRRVEAEIKIKAAKEILMEELQELKDINPTMALTLFSFTDTADLIFEGKVSDLRDVERAMETLKPYNGTDIAAALKAAADYKQTLSDTTLTQLVLISDGKSDRMEAMSAARQCLKRQLALTMLLIDPTDEGKAFARDVVRGVGGTWQPITSLRDFKEAAKDISSSYHTGMAHAERYLQAAESEAQSIEEEATDRTSVKFTSGYPGRIAPEHDYLLRVYLHLETQLAEVRVRLEQAADQFGAHPRRGDAESTQRIPIGTQLEVTPRINYIAANPPQQRVTWVGSIEELSFRIHYAGPATTPPPCSGFIDISASGLLLAQIPVSIQIGGDPLRLEQHTAEMISRVFASYSHDDERVVRACKAAYRALGIQLFIDKDDIIGGQVWQDVLRQSISNHDLFQLFWSQSAADSDAVANEWSLAKEIAPRRPNRFIRPVHWAKPMPDPPKALHDLHFDWLDLTNLQVSESDTLDEGEATPRKSYGTIETILNASFPIVDVVDTDPEWVSWLQQRMGEVVPFLEKLIGIRYFPPVTFLVEEHMVKTVREVLTTDASDSGEDELVPVLDMLQALALGFHVGKLIGTPTRFDQRAFFFEANDPKSREDFDHIVSMAEYVFTGPASKHFAGMDVLADARKSLKHILEGVIKGESSYGVTEMVRLTIEKASPDEQRMLSNVVTDETLESLDSIFDTKKAAANKLLQSDLPRLAEKYEVFEFFNRIASHSLRHHKTFQDYLADLVRHWLDYIRIAREKRGNAVIDVSYSVYKSTIDWLQKKFPEIGLQIAGTNNDQLNKQPRVNFEMHIDDYQRCVEKLSGLLFSMMHGGSGKKSCQAGRRRLFDPRDLHARVCEGVECAVDQIPGKARLACQIISA
jgi:hypothetical protein